MITSSSQGAMGFLPLGLESQHRLPPDIGNQHSRKNHTPKPLANTHRGTQAVS